MLERVRVLNPTKLLWTRNVTISRLSYTDAETNKDTKVSSATGAVGGVFVVPSPSDPAVQRSISAD